MSDTFKKVISGIFLATNLILIFFNPLTGPMKNFHLLNTSNDLNNFFKLLELNYSFSKNDIFCAIYFLQYFLLGITLPIFIKNFKNALKNMQAVFVAWAMIAIVLEGSLRNFQGLAFSAKDVSSYFGAVIFGWFIYFLFSKILFGHKRKKSCGRFKI